MLHVLLAYNRRNRYGISLNVGIKSFPAGCNFIFAPLFRN